MMRHITQPRPAVRPGNARLRAGLGYGGVLAGFLIGAPLLFPVITSPPASASWVSLVLVAAAGVYVLLAAFRDRSKVIICISQLVVAAALGSAAAAVDMWSIAAVGLVAHAVWYLWPLVREVRYVPAWYAGACVYVDLAAAVVVLLLR